jgi:hypothetical protein
VARHLLDPIGSIIARVGLNALLRRSATASAAFVDLSSKVPNALALSASAADDVDPRIARIIDEIPRRRVRRSA